MVNKKPLIKRGRPKSAQTLEKEATEAWLKNPPAHIPKMTAKERGELQEYFDSSEKARLEILEGYSPVIPKDLIYELSSLGDESVQGFENIILGKYKQYKNKETEGKITGAEEMSIQADTRAERLWGKNNKLMKRIDAGNISLNGAAKNIYDNWETKGIEGDKPTVKTISNWYKRIRPN